MLAVPSRVGAGVVCVAETIVLDPAAVATSRTAVDITPWLTDEGVDWGDSQIQAYLADGAIGESPVDYRLPNRQVTAPLKLIARGTVTFETIRRQLQAKVGLFQREGGWISRVTAAGGTVFADVVNASLKLGGDWMQANTTAAQRADVHAELSLELLPDWYGSEITLDDQTETTALALTKVLKLGGSDAVISGDYPGRVRILVDEDQGQSRLGLRWGFRSRYYDSATTAALLYEAEALTPITPAGTAVGPSGASGAGNNTILFSDSVPYEWRPVLSTRILSGTADMTHKGSYRVMARCQVSSGTDTRVRLVWDVGDLATPSENAPSTIPGPSNWYWRDLGEIRLDPTPNGTHKWMGEIQVTGGTAVPLYVDAVKFVPLDDGAGLVQAQQVLRPLSTLSGHDEFTSTTAGGTLGGRVAPQGGTWVSSGVATDWTFIDPAVWSPTEAIRRISVSDAGSAYRYGILGSTDFTYVTVSTNTYVDGVGTPGQMDVGVIARWVDANNHIQAQIYRTIVGTDITDGLALIRFIGGTAVTIAADTHRTPGGWSLGQWLNLSLTVDARGRAVAEVTATGITTGFPDAVMPAGTKLLQVQAIIPECATGGALATGKPGLVDRNTTADANGRFYDDFRFGVPPTLDAVVYANQSVELRTQGVFREDTAGTTWAATSPPIGSLPRIPVSGLEGRKVELMVALSRGDFDEYPDSGIDDSSVQVFYRPSWLFLS